MGDDAIDGDPEAVVVTLDDVHRYVRGHTPAFVGSGYTLFGDGAHGVWVKADPRDDGGHDIQIWPCSECGALEGRCIGLDLARTAWTRLLTDDEE